MGNMKNKTLWIVLLLLNFCAQAQKKKNNYYDSSNTGIVVGTISLENMSKITSKYSFFYSNDSIKALMANAPNKSKERKIRQKHRVELDVNYRGRDFVVDEKCYYIFKIEKPFGEYTFYEIELFCNTGYMISTWILPIKLPFTIEKNKVKYLGELNLKEKDAEFNLLDNFKIDSVQIIKKYPELNLSNAQ
jgi:hypothetical protein